jgi:hypothetical protein
VKRLLLVPAVAAALSLPATAQCVMCFRTAKAQNQARSKVMNAGILVLGAPPFLILTGFVVFLVKRNKADGQE